MNIVELGYALLTVGGVIVGTQVGYHHFGVAGAIGGFVVGGIVGLGIAYGLTFGFATIMSLIAGEPLFGPKKKPDDDRSS
jgi:hypothetical protein